MANRPLKDTIKMLMEGAKQDEAIRVSMEKKRKGDLNMERDMRNGFPMQYIGDSVYASFDGYQVWLHLDSHENEPVIALDPDVLLSLNKYYQDILKTYGKEG